MKMAPPSWRFAEMLTLLHTKGLLRRAVVKQQSHIVGDNRCARTYTIGLTPQMVTQAWLEMRVNALPPGVRPPVQYRYLLY